MTRWAMAVDLTRCVGCQTCTAACKQKNATPPGVQWRRVVDLEVGDHGPVGHDGRTPRSQKPLASPLDRGAA